MCPKKRINKCRGPGAGRVFRIFKKLKEGQSDLGKVFQKETCRRRG